MAEYRKLRIELSDEQHKSLEQIVRKGVSGAMEIRRANVLLLADEAGDRKRHKDVVHTSPAECRFRGKHGGRVRSLCKTV